MSAFPAPTPLRPKDTTIWFGYRYVWNPEHARALRGRVREDELVMEKLLRRPLREDEVVHHRDLNKLNSDAKNLMVCKKRVYREIRKGIINHLHRF